MLALLRLCVPCWITTPYFFWASTTIALPHVVAHRFLDVDMLARLGRPNGDERMPVVGRGDGDRVKRAVLERLANVGETFRLRFSIRLLGDRIQV